MTRASKGYLNDLWRYRLNDSTWTWISGNNTAGGLGIYGEKGDNTPGARYGSAIWYDSVNRELWLFGGYGYGSEMLSNSGA